MDGKTMAGVDANVAGDLALLCENRQHVYEFLSRCFEREIDGQLVEQCANGWIPEFDDTALNDVFAKVREEIAACDAVGIEDAAVDFNRVFFGMGPLAAEKAFPYESVYTSDGGLMMQDAYSAVVVEYREAGFAKDPEFTEPEDHIAVELSYMAARCKLAVCALSHGDEKQAEEQLLAQRAFLRSHLGEWVERFAADVKRAAQMPLYADVAACLVAFLHADALLLDEVIE